MMSLINVMKLTQWDFNSAVSSYEFIAVLFLNSRSYSCFEFVEQYEKAAARIRSQSPNIIIAMVDVTKDLNKYLAIHYKIWREWTVKIFKNGGKSVEDYKGPRDCEGIVNCLKWLSRLFPAEIKSIEEVGSDDRKIMIVGVFSDFSGQVYENFVKAAEKLKWDYDFYKHLRNGPAEVGFFNLYKDNMRFFNIEHFDVDALVQFLKDASPRVLTVYNEHNPLFVDDFFNKESWNDKAILLIKRGDVDAHDFLSEYRKIAKKCRLLGINSMLGFLEDSKEALSYFGIPASEVPMIVIRKPSGDIYVKSDLTLDDDIDGWLKDYRLGQVAKYEVSEPIPEENDEHVEVVITDKFGDKAINSWKMIAGCKKTAD